ncbi:hypothetical protein HANVADRAFT_54111, partial [Hanseniaspora valbyensis NRRL Y-1626]
MLCYDEILPATSFKKTIQCDNIIENGENKTFLLALDYNNDLKIFNISVKSSTKVRTSRMASFNKEKTDRAPPIPVLDLYKEIKLDSCVNINDFLIIKNNNKDFDKIALLLDDKISIIQYDFETKNFETRSLHQYGFANDPIDSHIDDIESKLSYKHLTLSKNGQSDNGILIWKPNSIIHLNLLEANKNIESNSGFRVKRRKFNPVSRFLKLSNLVSDLANIIDIKRHLNKLVILYAPRGTAEAGFPGVKNKLKLVTLTLNESFFDQLNNENNNNETTYTTILNHLNNITDDIHSIFCIDKNYVLLGTNVVMILDENLNTNYCIPLNETYEMNESEIQFNNIIEDYKTMNITLNKEFSNGVILSTSIFIINNLLFQLEIDNDSISQVKLLEFLNEDQLPFSNVHEIKNLTLFNSDSYYKTEKFLKSTTKNENDVYDSLVVVFNRDLYGEDSVAKKEVNYKIEVIILNPCLEPNYTPMTDVISAPTLGFYKQQQLAISPNFAQEDLVAVGPSYNTVYEIITNKQHYFVKKVVRFVEAGELFNLSNKYLVTTSNNNKSSILRIGNNNNFSPILRLMDFQYDSKTLACSLCKSLRYFIQVTSLGIWILDMDNCKYKNKYIFKFAISDADTLEDYINTLEINGKTALFLVGKNRMKPVSLQEPPELNRLFITMTKLAYFEVEGRKTVVKFCLTASDKIVLFDVITPRAKLYEIKNIEMLPNNLEIVLYDASNKNTTASTSSISINNFDINQDIITISNENIFVCYNKMVKAETRLLKNTGQQSYMKKINEFTYTIGVDTLVTNKSGQTKNLGHLSAVVNLDSLGNVFLIDPIGVARLINVNDFFKHNNNVVVHRLPFDKAVDKKQRMFGSIKYLQSENIFACSYIDQTGSSGIVLLEYGIDGKFKIFDEYICEKGFVVGCMNTTILRVSNVGADAFLARNAKDEYIDNQLEIVKLIEKNMRKIVRSQEEQVIPLNIAHNKKVQLESSYINLHLPKLTARSIEENEFLVIGENEITGEFELSRSRVELFSINREENPFIDMDYEK